MNRIEELTDEQDHLMATLAAEWENDALCGDDRMDHEPLRKGIDLIYSLADLPSPEVVICKSPLDMAQQANLKKGETIDSLGNAYDSGWTAFYDYMERIGVRYDDDMNFSTWRDFVKKSGVFGTVLCEHVAFVCPRPIKVNRNEAGDLHKDGALAIEWRDGYGEYFLNGVSMTEDQVLTPGEQMDPVLLLKEQNAEVRRELVRKMGIERVVLKLGAEVIDEAHGYQLLLLDLKDGRKREYLKMKNPSIGVYHIEGVEPGIKTVAQALAWRNGIETMPAVLT